MCVNEFAAQRGFLDSLLFFKELPFVAAFLGQMQPQRRAAPCHAVLHLLGPARRENSKRWCKQVLLGGAFGPEWAKIHIP